MLIIGHRGAAGLAPENTAAAIQAGIIAGADMIELDVRLTKDGKLVVIHDARLLRTHHVRDSVAQLTYAEIKELTKDLPVPLLQKVLDKYFGHIMFNIELKSRRSGEALISLLQKRYIERPSDWDKLIISSFHGTELLRIRRLAPQANLAMLHNQNPFLFVAYHRLAKLTAVGFHRLYLNRFALEIAHKAKLFIYVYTVNRPAALPLLKQQGIEGVVTNYPDKFVRELERQKTNAS